MVYFSHGVVTSFIGDTPARISSAAHSKADVRKKRLVFRAIAAQQFFNGAFSMTVDVFVIAIAVSMKKTGVIFSTRTGNEKQKSN
jgi:hypothetical protein